MKNVKGKWSAFWIGVISTFSIWPDFPYRKSLSNKETIEADRKALESDWEAVGKDMWNAIGEFEGKSKDK